MFVAFLAALCALAITSVSAVPMRYSARVCPFIGTNCSILDPNITQCQAINFGECVERPSEKGYAITTHDALTDMITFQAYTDNNCKHKDVSLTPAQGKLGSCIGPVYTQFSGVKVFIQVDLHDSIEDVRRDNVRLVPGTRNPNRLGQNFEPLAPYPTAHMPKRPVPAPEPLAPHPTARMPKRPVPAPEPLAPHPTARMPKRPVPAHEPLVPHPTAHMPKRPVPAPEPLVPHPTAHIGKK